MTRLGHRSHLEPEGQRRAVDDWFLAWDPSGVTDRWEETGKVTRAGKAAGEFAFKGWILASLRCRKPFPQPQEPPWLTPSRSVLPFGFTVTSCVFAGKGGACVTVSSLWMSAIGKQKLLKKSRFSIGLQSSFYQLFRVMHRASNDLLFSKLGKYTLLMLSQ